MNLQKTDQHEKLLFCQDIFLTLATFFSKFSIFLLYLQIFSIHKTTRMAIWAGMIYNFIIYAPNFGIHGALCAPAPGQPWTFEVMENCSRSDIIGPIQGTLGLLEDIYIFVLPIPALSRLQMKNKKKIGLLFIFGIALL